MKFHAVHEASEIAAYFIYPYQVHYRGKYARVMLEPNRNVVCMYMKHLYRHAPSVPAYSAERIIPLPSKQKARAGKVAYTFRIHVSLRFWQRC
jgi:hypothetical protein